MPRWDVLLTLFATAAMALCPARPSLRDTDASVTVWAQNIKFIATGGYKDRRAEMLAAHLDTDTEVDLLLLSEARALDPLRDAMPNWCLYTQTGPETAYVWGLEGPAPGGLALAVRNRTAGVERAVSPAAGRVYRARPVTLAEGFLGRLVGFEKGWAVASVDGTEFVWTHAQASYARSPVRGAGRPGFALGAPATSPTGVGRAGQFDDLAVDLRDVRAPVLLTGDLNVLDGTPSASPKVSAAGEVDRQTLIRFTQHTGITFPADRGPCTEGSFLGTIKAAAKEAFPGLILDRVGTNTAFANAHAGTQTTCEHISSGGLSVSDHLGVRIAAPFQNREATQ